MKQFLVPYNPNDFDALLGYSELKEIDWTIRSKHIGEGDEVFFYCSKPIQAIVIKGIVTKVDVDYSEMIDDSKYYVTNATTVKSVEEYKNGLKLTRVKLISILSDDKKELLTLSKLKEVGFKGYPQSTRILDNFPNIQEYINFVCDK